MSRGSQQIHVQDLTGGTFQGGCLGYECLEPDGFTLKICGIVKFQIYFLLGENLIELVEIARETHQLTRDGGGILCLCVQTGADKNRNDNGQDSDAFHICKYMT